MVLAQGKDNTEGFREHQDRLRANSWIGLLYGEAVLVLEGAFRFRSPTSSVVLLFVSSPKEWFPWYPRLIPILKFDPSPQPIE